MGRRDSSYDLCGACSNGPRQSYVSGRDGLFDVLDFPGIGPNSSFYPPVGGNRGAANSIARSLFCAATARQERLPREMGR